MKRSDLFVRMCNALTLTFLTSAGVAYAQEQTGAGHLYVSVRDFGAVGDGKADDSGAFQRALDSGRGDIFVPRGVYQFARSVVVDLDKVGPVSVTGSGTAKIVMAGAGPAFKLIGTHEGTADPDSVKENVWRNQRMPVISGLEIVGDNPKACGVEASGTMKAIFSQLAIREALHGIHLTVRNRNVIISDCHIYKNRGIGVYLDHVNLHQINVGDSHISYNGGGGVVQDSGQVRNLQIGNCDIEANMSEDGPAAANVFIDATGGSIGEIAITGCTLQHTHTAPGSANIRIIGEGLPRAYAQGELRGGNVAITGNILSDVQINIHLKKVRGVTVVGNTIWKGYEHDLLVEDSSSIAVGPNVFDRNPRYHYGDGAEANRGLVFRNCDQVMLTGVQVNNVWRKDAGLIMENCRHFNISGCTLIDCDGCGISFDNVQDTIVSGCVIHDTRKDPAETIALQVKDGRNNLISNNLFIGRRQIAPGSVGNPDR